MKSMRLGLLWLLLWTVPCTAADVYGPTLADELVAAGLGGVQFGWRADGLVTYGPSLTAAQVTAIQQVLAAHNPTKQLPPPPRWSKFLQWIPSAFDAVTINTLANAYGSFFGAAQFGNAAQVQWCVTDAHSKGVITAAQYALFQGANTTYHLGLTLP